jgi:hypothetical protein
MRFHHGAFMLTSRLSRIRSRLTFMEDWFTKALQAALQTALQNHASSVPHAEPETRKLGLLGLQERSHALAEKYEFELKEATKTKSGKPGRLAERRPKLNRDKLARLIARDKQTTLTVQEWVLLDLLLRDVNSTGLANLLQPRSWVDHVVSLGNVVFSVGSRAQRFGGNELELVFAYDLRAVTELSRHLDRRAGTALDSDILYAPVMAAESDAAPLRAPARYPSEAVFEASGSRHDIKTAGPPTVMIGSTATNPATEVALALALGFQPWHPQQRPESLPFWFAWPSGVGQHSTFSNRSRAANLKNPERLFSFNGKEHPLSRDEGETHGVVVIAKRERPIVVIAGTTAAATYACAQKAPGINADFPDPEHPVIAHVKAQVSYDESLPGPEKRKLEEAEVRDVLRWDRKNRRWA